MFIVSSKINSSLGKGMTNDCISLVTLEKSRFKVTCLQNLKYVCAVFYEGGKKPLNPQMYQSMFYLNR